MSARPGLFLPPRKDAATAHSLLSGQPVTVMGVASPSDTDLRRIVGHTRWELLETSTIEEALARLAEFSVAVVICQPEMPDGTWMDLLDRTSRLRIPSPVLVASSNAGDSLWMEVLNRGGYNVIVKPFNEHDLVRLVSLAWRQGQEKARLQVRATAG